MEVWRRDKGYLPHLINGKDLEARVTLKQAMESAGILQEAEVLACQLKGAQAQKVLDRDARERRGLHDKQSHASASRPWWSRGHSGRNNHAF